ncbi:hypothetical protein PACTADRAFT_48046 [Pachysolen tannophilus NRRL Y-2460]|uniref:Amino acid transporter transmembrane domain-containing protein n=1 Tax=Pachysolen tannophilus NRRL Y-2460 TaxID=669874 RepID=A0A1E4U2N3_PACTA|nr:hypothetical protein PACTADRAFT_48046 [Pachysolen tannophilus NRRL Y-2460]
MSFSNTGTTISIPKKQNKSNTESPISTYLNGGGGTGGGIGGGGGGEGSSAVSPHSSASSMYNGPGSSYRRASIAKLASGSPLSGAISVSMGTADALSSSANNSNFFSNSVDAAGRGRKSLRLSFVRHSRENSFTPNNNNNNNNNSNNINNSINNNINGHQMFDNSSTFESDRSSSLSFGIDGKDPTLIKAVNKHLPNSKEPLSLQGGDVARDLYKFDENNNAVGQSGKMKRSKSISSTDINNLRKYSQASSINVPGGFRREFIVRQTNAQNIKNGHQLTHPTFLTKNFIEFLSVYGHFAGEDLEDEDYVACDVINPDHKGFVDEESPLLSHEVTPTSPISPSSSKNGTASVVKSFLILLKGFVGTGILFLPKAFLNGGLFFSIAALLFFGALSFWCYLILVQSKLATGVISFGDIGLKLYGKSAKVLILFSIVLSQIGFVGAYIVFTSENIRAFLVNIFNWDVSIKLLVLLQVLIFIPLSMFRNITKLSLAALLANIFILFGLVSILYFTFKSLLANGIGPNIKYFNKSSFSLFIGVAIFAFEGIGLILPVQESMRNPEKFPLVLLLVILCCSVLFSLVGALCYATFGDQVQTVIIFNLPQDSIVVNLIQLFYALAILLSAPLQIFPAIKIIENRIFAKNLTGKYDMKIKWLKNLFRTAFVVFTGFIAYFGADNLDKFVSFVGCFACIPLVYMYPPLLHYKSVSNTFNMKCFDIFLVVLGAVAMAYTSYQIIFE